MRAPDNSAQCCNSLASRSRTPLAPSLTALRNGSRGGRTSARISVRTVQVHFICLRWQCGLIACVSPKRWIGGSPLLRPRAVFSAFGRLSRTFLSLRAFLSFDIGLCGEVKATRGCPCRHQGRGQSRSSGRRHPASGIEYLAELEIFRPISHHCGSLRRTACLIRTNSNRPGNSMAGRRRIRRGVASRPDQEGHAEAFSGRKSRYRERIPRMRLRANARSPGEQERRSPNYTWEALQPGNTVEGAQFGGASSTFLVPENWKLTIDRFWKCAAVPPLSTATPAVSKTEHEVKRSDRRTNKIRVTEYLT